MKRLWVFLVWVPLLAAGIVPDRYIVELQSPPVAVTVGMAGRSGRGAAVAHRARIQNEQSAMRARIEQAGGTVAAAIDTVANALIVNMPDADAHRLPAMPGVKRVYRVHEYRPMLYRALPLHKAPQAWDLIGGRDNAGWGIKIAILDTGLDLSHPAFQDDSLQMPEGYPRGSQEADFQFTNNKVIVARSYGDDPDPQDRFGHGTAVAMAAAGVPNESPEGVITGVAPKAWLGNYKITHGSGGSATTGTIARAINDAIDDGMDVINFSFGDSEAERPSDDFLVQVMENATAAGIVVVVSAGNEGSDPNTIASPATAPSVIAVGATDNGARTAAVVDGTSYPAKAPAEATLRDSISGTLVDVETLDPTGLACDSLPADSLAGKIAFVRRGTCTFETKLNNAQAAGASAVLLFTHEFDPEIANPWTVQAATLPALMVTNADGLVIKERIAANPELQVTLEASSEVSSFSSRGPSADLAIKPDLVAIGSSLVDAVQRTFPEGGMYMESGYARISGTSFSAPIVTGAAALLKGARPSLGAQDYRSLLVNSADPLSQSDSAQVQRSGTGFLDIAAAVRNTVAAFPTSISFGAGDSTVEASREITIANLGTEPDTFVISAVPSGDGPNLNLSETSLTLDPGARGAVTLQFSGTALEPGQYQGFVQVQGSRAEALSRVPYWYAVPSNVPVNITILNTDVRSSSGEIDFRVTDASGLPVRDPAPQVTLTSGEGELVEVRDLDALVPGAWRAQVRLGSAAGSSVFEISAGDQKRSVRLTGSSSALPPGHP